MSVFRWTGQLPKVNEQQHQARENMIRALQSNDFVAILDSAMDEASKQLCVGCESKAAPLFALSLSVFWRLNGRYPMRLQAA